MRYNYKYLNIDKLLPIIMAIILSFNTASTFAGDIAKKAPKGLPPTKSLKRAPAKNAPADGDISFDVIPASAFENACANPYYWQEYESENGFSYYLVYVPNEDIPGDVSNGELKLEDGEGFLIYPLSFDTIYGAEITLSTATTASVYVNNYDFDNGYSYAGDVTVNSNKALWIGECSIFTLFPGGGDLFVKDIKIYFSPVAVEDLFTVKVPVIMPESCAFYNPLTITMSAEDGCDIYYTTDSSTPSLTNGVKYENSITIDKSTSFKIIAINSVGTKSPVLNSYYQCTKHGIGEDYNPSSPPDPNSADGQKKHQLLLTVNPSEAGYTNNYFSYDDKGRVTEGASGYVRAYANSSSFTFINWTCDGEVVSENYQYNFTMPDHDVALVANFEYKPSSPSDPQDPVFKYPVTVTCQPSGAGWFNLSSSSLAEGETMDIHAYNYTNFRFKGWKVDGKVIEQTASPLNITMGRKPISVVGLYDYYPSSPANPGANYWNPTTGQLIVDDFTTGNLYSTINNLVGYDNFSNISSIIVKGKVNDNDFGGMRNSDYVNLASLDITRVDGITAIPSYAFEYSHVGSVYLPACITSVGSYAFYNCDNLTSISVYAMVPPTANNRTFSNFTNKANCVVRVPSEVIPLYEAAPYWNEFTILPLAEELHALQVNLPDDCSDGRYKNNRIELVNIASGARQKYVITDRLAYTFIGLQKDEQFNVYLFSQTGLEIGRIENVLMGEADQDVTFSHLKTVKDASVTVKTPDGTDVTSQVAVEWYEPKADGTSVYLRKTATLGEVPVGQKLDCRFTLPQQLGTVYANPKDETFEVTDETSAFTINLVPLRSITLSGEVVDENGAAINGAAVSVNSMLNGKFSTTVNAKTGRDGKWTATLLDAPEYRLTYSAQECVNVLDTVPALAETESELALEKVTMRSIASARVQYSFTYMPAHKEGADAEFTEYYNDYKNVTVSVYNLTQNRPHQQLSLQYPTIVILDENVKAGDRLQLTAHSTTGAFNDIVKEVTVGDDQRAAVQFDITGKGGIEARFSMTENPAVIAMLYNANGALVKTVDYSEAVAKFNELADGEYSIVSIGKSSLLNGVQRLVTLSDVGLVAGTDYVLSKVSVKEGIIAEVKNELVPPFDENRFCYTTSTTSFSVNKSSVTPGNYLTLRSTVDFKAMYKSGITDVKMIYDLPDNCEMVTGSVMKGNQIIPYEQDGKQIIVPLGNIGYTEQIRFVVIPTSGGEFKPMASVNFSVENSEISQPIGAAQCQVKDLEISVPSEIASPKFNVSGLAPAKSSVKVYDGDNLIGETISLANGSWSVKCELISPRNLSEHNIQAFVKTNDGMELKSSTQKCYYDKNAIEARTVTMSFFNGWLRQQVEVIFDFQTCTTNTSSYMFYTGTDITFMADLTNNDPSIVSDVTILVYTDKGEIRKLNASYDEKADCWVAVSHFESNNLPVNVNISFSANTVVEGDYSEMEEMQEGLSDMSDEISETLVSIDDILSNIDDADINGMFDALTSLLEASGGGKIFNDVQDIDLTNADAIKDRLAEIKLGLDELNSIQIMLESYTELSLYGDEFIDGFQMSSKRLSEMNLALDSFEEITTIDGEIVYVKWSNDQFEFAFPYKDLYLTVTNANVQSILRRISEGDKGGVKDLLAWIQKLNDLAWQLREKIRPLEDIIKDFLAKADAAEKEASYLKSLLNQQDYLLGEGIGIEDIKNNLKRATEKAAKYRTLAKIGSAVRKAIPIYNAVDLILTLSNDINTCIGIYYSIPDPCEDDQAAADALRGETLGLGAEIGAYGVLQATMCAMEIGALIPAVAAATTTLGTSLLVEAALIASQIASGWVYERILPKRFDMIRKGIDDLECKKKKGCQCLLGGPCTCGGKCKCKLPPPIPPINPIHDPSGYVYEAIHSNRVEGVQATIYYKETVEDMYGDLSENIVLWDAEEYAQKNPLFTDENGMYAWDVPQGLWQVKFEKDGYVTTQSEWLPVPPPQLEVNIPIVQNKQPEVVDAHAYETGIQITFDKYMDKQTVNAKNVYLTVGGKKAAGEVVVIEEEGAEDNKYATTFRFVPEERLSMSQGEIRLTVSREVKSYAGIPMTSNYSQVFDIEKEITDITTNDNGQLLYGGEKTITVDVIPFDASVGKKLKVKNSSPSIMSVESDEIEIDENGQAQVKLTGELPGQAMLTFSVDDSYAKGEVIINVVTELYEISKPVASRASGTEVYRGTKVSLSTETPNATIYYTTDGSCPCDENGTRKKFILPIEITEDMDIKAMVETSNNEASEVAEFHYSLKKSDLDYTMAEGWTWISHNLETTVEPEKIGNLEPVQRIVGQTAEVVRDPAFGLVGNLKEMSAEQSYKVEASAATENLRLTDIARNPATPINVKAGWNWLGYTPGQTMSVTEAFSTTEVAENDYIVGQRGFAQYNGTEWEGTLETLVPGTGYLFNSQSDKQVVYNTNIVSQAAAANARLFSSASPWAVDVNKYPQIMCMVVTIEDADGNAVSPKNHHFGAFSESECRGIAKVVNGKYMMSVYGRTGDKIDFRLVPVDGENELVLNETIDFAETMIGNVNIPYLMRISSEANSISSVEHSQEWKIKVNNGTLYLTGGNLDKVSSVSIINLDGVKVLGTTNAKHGRVSLAGIPAGIYVVVIVENGKYSYHKIVIK